MRKIRGNSLQAYFYEIKQSQRKWPKSVYFGGDQKYGRSQSYGNGFDSGMVSTNSRSLSMRGRYKIEIAEWKCPPIFQNKRVRYARADKLELYSSTTLPVKHRHQPISRFDFFTYCRWISTTTARQECATLSLYTTYRTTDRRRTDVVC